MSKKIILKGREFNLPEYIDVLQNVSDKNSDCIVACGVRNDGTLIIITGAGEVRELKPNGKTVPVKASPVKEGHFIEVHFKNYTSSRILSSALVVRSSKNCLLGGELHLGNIYVGNFEISQDVGYNENNDSGTEEDNL